MGQVTEPAPRGGQILASIAPGEWNITWVRDMAYADGRPREERPLRRGEGGARVPDGRDGRARTSRTSAAPYQISVCRYYGDGTEWSDSNTDGPNIEFDGFGLFLWALDEYVKASGDTASLTTWWPTVKSKVADVLVSLQEPSPGSSPPTRRSGRCTGTASSEHFAYTTIAAANGLCSAVAPRDAGGRSRPSATTYLTAGPKARDAVLKSLRAPDGTIAQSTESLASGSAWLDAPSIEAINFGLFDPTRGTAHATLSVDRDRPRAAERARASCATRAGHVLRRRSGSSSTCASERALELHGETANQTSLFAWNTDQAIDNFGELSELHDPTTADYAGRVADGRLRRRGVPHRAGRSRHAGHADVWVVRERARAPRRCRCTG